MLARLDKIEGVERSYANYTGSLIRLCVAPAGDRAKVAAEAARVLSNESPAEVPTAELKATLGQEEWRDVSQVGELTTIEYRILALRAALVGAPVLILIGLVIAWRRCAARATSS